MSFLYLASKPEDSAGKASGTKPVHHHCHVRVNLWSQPETFNPRNILPQVYLGIGLGYALLFVLYVIPFLRTCRLCELLVGLRRLVKDVLDITHKHIALAA